MASGMQAEEGAAAASTAVVTDAGRDGGAATGGSSGAVTRSRASKLKHSHIWIKVQAPLRSSLLP